MANMRFCVAAREQQAVKASPGTPSMARKPGHTYYRVCCVTHTAVYVMVGSMGEQEAGDASRIVEATAPFPTATARRRLASVPKASEAGSGATVLVRTSLAQSCCLADSWQSVRVFRRTTGGRGSILAHCSITTEFGAPGLVCKGPGK